MRKLLFTLLPVLLLVTLAGAQKNSPKNNRTRIGLKAGYTWSYVTANQSGLNLNNTSGYMFGAFLAPASHGFMGYRTEIIYSHQGFEVKDGNTTTVNNNYIYMPHLTTFSIGKFFQLQVGAQVGYLLNAKKTSGGKDSSVTDFMNRFDYGLAGGVELNPIAGLIIGARYNLGLGNIYKNYTPTSPTSMPPSMPTPSAFGLPFDPSTLNLKNGVIQLFVGYKF